MEKLSKEECVKLLKKSVVDILKEELKNYQNESDIDDTLSFQKQLFEIIDKKADECYQEYLKEDNEKQE